MNDKKYASLNTLSQFLNNIKPDLVPSGIIVMWSGDVNNIPNGWHLCDGAEGTPDLRDKFVLGAGNNYLVGDIGGEKEHVLNINEIPSHAHPVHAGNNPSQQLRGLASASPTDGGAWGFVDYPESNSQGSDFFIAGEVGGNQPHNNMPPYYALCYIIKV